MRSQAKLLTKFSRANSPSHGQLQLPDGQPFYAGAIDAPAQIQLLGVNTSFCSTSSKVREQS